VPLRTSAASVAIFVKFRYTAHGNRKPESCQAPAQACFDDLNKFSYLLTKCGSRLDSFPVSGYVSGMMTNELKAARRAERKAEKAGYAAGLEAARATSNTLVQVDGPAAYVTAFQRAYRIERAQLETRAVVKTGKCPACGRVLRRNSSLTGWWQCSQLGAETHRADPSQPSCSWQGLTE
jgi:hypothetical protein